MIKSIVYLLVGVLIGIIIGSILSGQTNQVPRDTVSESKKLSHGMDVSMNQMTQNLESLSGDEFDKAFIEQMIDHHQGAIDMANLVLEKSEKKELKDLANAIIEAQTKEIEMMEGWLESWY